MNTIRYFSGVFGLMVVPGLAFGQEEPGGGGFQMLIGFALIIGIFYFLIIRPQSKRAKEHANFVASLEKGDAVVTQSGLYGKVYGLTEQIVTLEIAPNVRVRVDRNSVTGKDQTAVGEAKSKNVA